MEELGAQKGLVAQFDTRRASPVLKALVVEASQALAQLDHARLEELALSCQALSRGLGSLNRSQGMSLAKETREVVADMAVFGRVLEATRANLNVMKRLRELRLGRLEYNEKVGVKAQSPMLMEEIHGDD